ncbi:MAG: tRNA uridine-5-carboxymethylaminomethyl(34) synthesis GTPase MnmE [bacterium]
MKKDLKNDNDTIAAISTPPGEGAIGIVRLSGNHVYRILRDVFLPAKPRHQYQSHRLYYGAIIDESNNIIDQVMIAFMKADKTYTGEDMLEIYTHGGSNTVHAVLQRVIKAGARLAERGEFTRRAFLNGKMDLLQAEAVLDLVKADTDIARKQAINQITGLLSRFVGSIREKLIEVKTHIEVMIDFPEDDVSPKQWDDLKLILQATHDEVIHVLKTYDHAKIIKDGIHIALVGKPNVGKSSLFNAIIGENRAIVTPHPGTTRDYIEEAIEYKGIKLVFADTAGIRSSDEPIEKIGIEMTKSLIDKTDMIVIVVDPTTGEDFDSELSLADKYRERVIIAINKIDIASSSDLERAKTMFKAFSVFHVSAKTQEGIEYLKQGITEPQRIPSIENTPVINRYRHKQALERIEVSLRKAMELIDQQAFPEIIAEEVDGAIAELGELTGEITSQDILDKIFSEFCIGK